LQSALIKKPKLAKGQSRRSCVWRKDSDGYCGTGDRRTRTGNVGLSSHVPKFLGIDGKGFSAKEPEDPAGDLESPAHAEVQRKDRANGQKEDLKNLEAKVGTIRVPGEEAEDVELDSLPMLQGSKETRVLNVDKN